MRFRADQVFWGELRTPNGESVCFVSIVECADMQAEAQSQGEKKAKKLGIKGPFLPIELTDLTEASPDIYSKIPYPATGVEGDLTPPRDFNLMFQTNVGAMSDASTVAYLRPETAQGIFTNFVAAQRSARMKASTFEFSSRCFFFFQKIYLA